MEKRALLNGCFNMFRDVCYLQCVQFLLEPVFDYYEFHFTTPVYSFINPTLGVQFILHILILIVNFDIELDIVLESSFREFLQNAKLLGQQTK